MQSVRGGQGGAVFPGRGQFLEKARCSFPRGEAVFPLGGGYVGGGVVSRGGGGGGQGWSCVSSSPPPPRRAVPELSRVLNAPDRSPGCPSPPRDNPVTGCRRCVVVVPPPPQMLRFGGEGGGDPRRVLALLFPLPRGVGMSPPPLGHWGGARSSSRLGWGRDTPMRLQPPSEALGCPAQGCPLSFKGEPGVSPDLAPSLSPPVHREPRQTPRAALENAEGSCCRRDQRR